MSLSLLKSRSTNNLDRLKKEAEKLRTANGGGDTRFWYPDTNKEGNGYAVIRFLPAPAVDVEKYGSDASDYVKVFSRAFKNEHDEWYIENDLSTIGKKDPCGELCSLLWKTGMEDDKELARKYKRKTNYYANILVVNDKANPENNGKVFLFKFGSKIYEKIENAIEPKFDEEPFDPFDFWNGAHFVIRITTKEFRNYDQSSFEKCSPLSKDEAELEKIWKECHSLQDFISPSAFKTYEELLENMNKVLPDDEEHRGGAAGRMKDSKKGPILTGAVSGTGTTNVANKSLPEKKAPMKRATLEETVDGDGFDPLPEVDDDEAALRALAASV